MKPQIALSPSEMAELKSLGLDCSDASMCWVAYTDEHAPTLEVNQFANLDYVEKYTPAYTLEDMLIKLINFGVRYEMKEDNEPPLQSAFELLKWATEHIPDKIKKIER